MRGRFIVLEGPDGSGTTTHAAFLARSLEEQGEKVLLTQEPTDGPIGAFIRTQLHLGTIPADALQMLFSADRAWHVAETVLPALHNGITVLSDRYTLSTVVYGQALGLDVEWLQDMNKKFIQPDYQIIALPSFDVCQERVNRRDGKDMLESRLDLQKKVYDSYAQTALQQHFPVVDTSGSKNDVANAFLALVSRR